MAVAALAALAFPLWAHSVGQVQTTKFFSPTTVNMLKTRAVAGSAGFLVGDQVEYIIQFSPVSNNASYGANGYVTDYIPPGTQVIQASFVEKTGVDANGDPVFADVAPALPGLMPVGWGAGQGAGAQRTYTGVFSAGSTYDPTGQCARSIYSTTDGAAYNSGATNFSGNNCTGMLSTIYADTGIFYSTDARTAQYPALPTRLLQGVAGNGYTVTPNRATQLEAILGETVATTHNQWDACNTWHFGSLYGDTNPASCTGTQIMGANLGGYNIGATPYMAGSAVAGPQTGYTLDYTGNVGPWNRIYYAGSRIGDPTLGPATQMSRTTAGVNNATAPLALQDGGASTSLGWVLSPSNPLPSGVNAVRWAMGKLTVGQINYVKITLLVTSPVGSAGVTNGSEVFGGDASDLTSAAGNSNSSIDNPWLYHVPSVADNNSNLYVSKVLCSYDASATTCTPLAGSSVNPSTTITYQILYLNTGNAVQNTVTLVDYFPCQTAAGGTVTIGSVSGPLASLMTVPYTTTTIAGNCSTSPQTRSSMTFPVITSLNPGVGGAIILNVKNTQAVGSTPTVNTALLKSNEVPAGVTSNAVSFASSTTTNANPSMAISKSTTTPSVSSGGTAQYVIVVQNTGVSKLTTITIADVLPTMGGASASPSTRFNYSSTSSIQASGLTLTTTAVTAVNIGSVTFSTNTAANFTPALTPYNSMSGAANAVVANWYFGSSTLAAGGIITITFTVNLGTAVAASPTPYTNNALTTAGTPASPIYRIDTNNVAGITVSSGLSITKTLSCYYDTTSGVCVAPSGSGNIPSNARVVYNVNYANTGGSAVSTVTISDLLPCQLVGAGSTASATVTAVAGPIAAISTTYTVSNGNCPSTQSTIVLGTISSLASGASGTFTVDMKLSTPSTTSTVVKNKASISGSGVTGSSSEEQNQVASLASLQITKASTSTTVAPGGTIGYTITITNVGTTAAQTITVYDWLPTGTATSADLTRRFSRTLTSVISGSLTSTGMTTATNVPPTQSPYSAGTYAANQEELVWSFGSQTLGVGKTATIQLTAAAGSNLPPLTAPNYYYNNAVVTYYSNQSAAANSLGVSVTNWANLALTKTNNTTQLYKDGTTSYILTATNGGPASADGAKVVDGVATGLSCTAVSCTATSGGAACPATLTISALQGSGLVIPTFPSGSSVTLKVDCTVTATGS